ncbi:hypothetical protein GZ77_24995 [Endozoicomonas montiporae]|uniref:Uncharacterized protein n=2 Tax=Endozoicomonas montiporae TaxID=1027273 RepID=A0A081MYV2_9GAMM|nr:hypothetical protein [Endozoicomonas montiporae]AMO54839.1 metal dependent phosphohydrolase [Endozoicomonas montiporae CL-33]KEQ11375.1 hypothetical protein GZ77_24995 [Endozoicomonas montiporae]
MQDCLQYIETRARDFYRKQDVFHNERHGERVVAYALSINRVEQADRFLVEAGAWLHQFHDHLHELRQLLDSTGLDEFIKEQLFQIVRLCRPHLINEQSPLAARVVFDADAMDLMGAYGITRELSCNLQIRGMNYQQAVQATRDVQRLFEETLSTPTGKALAHDQIVAARAFWSDFDLHSSP